MKKFLLLSVFLLWSGIANALDVVATYDALLNKWDHYSSTGTWLKSIKDVLQQDRANYYKFGKRDPQDKADGYFTTYQRRLLFQKLPIRISPQLKRDIEQGIPRFVTVAVFDSYIDVAPNLPPPD